MQRSSKRRKKLRIKRKESPKQLKKRFKNTKKTTKNLWHSSCLKIKESKRNSNRERRKSNPLCPHNHPYNRDSFSQCPILINNKNVSLTILHLTTLTYLQTIKAYQSTMKGYPTFKAKSQSPLIDSNGFKWS
jgi:hypothetical protein